MEKLTKSKVLRDPIHGNIYVEYKVIWQCLYAKEMQRLKRIHQLGGTFQIYQMGEHSRFAHSVGVYAVTKKMIDVINGKVKYIDAYDELTLLLAGLLHDLGHGPFSHAFEAISCCHHEEYTCQIIEKDSEINSILVACNPNLPKDIVAVLKHKHPKKLLNQIVSAQIDADRMDYLLRDSYFSGVSYGQFDLDYILRSIQVVDNQIVFSESGIHSIEDYIMARYQMYQQVYLHPAGISYELLLRDLFERLRQLYKKEPSFFNDLAIILPFMEKQKVTNLEHFLLDEYSLFAMFLKIKEKNDEKAANLAERLMSSRLYEYEEFGIGEECDDKAITISSKIYDHESDQAILILNKKNEIKELSSVSFIVNAIINGKLPQEKKIRFNKE